MRTVLRLYAADLHYPPELQLYTAASGPIGALAARYLALERADGLHGAGEVRANITYLSHLPEAAVDPAILDFCRRLPWSAAPEEILVAIQRLDGVIPRVAAAAVENALIDAIARRDGISVAQWLGGQWRAAIDTNQCLFWGPDETFDRLARRFVAEGFREIKVRVAVGSPKADLARLKRLREIAGTNVAIAVDANGAWSADEAIERLNALEPIGLSYAEQPTPPGDWTAFRKVRDSTSVPLMADESLATPADIDALCAIGPPALAHLKIVKLGGPTAVRAAARRLHDAGIAVMIGQMNEGALATALTAHCAMALAPRYAEIYGCYGLLDDVTPGVSYAGGQVAVPPGPGLGTTFDAVRCRSVWVETID